jgi:hypothetical protein
MITKTYGLVEKLTKNVHMNCCSQIRDAEIRVFAKLKYAENRCRPSSQGPESRKQDEMGEHEPDVWADCVHLKGAECDIVKDMLETIENAI